MRWYVLFVSCICLYLPYQVQLNSHSVLLRRHRVSVFGVSYLDLSLFSLPYFQFVEVYAVVGVGIAGCQCISFPQRPLCLLTAGRNLTQNISVATNVLGLVTDAGISIIMIVLLQRAKTGFKRSTDLLNRLVGSFHRFLVIYTEI
jgi:hypothetical protein